MRQAVSASSSVAQNRALSALLVGEGFGAEEGRMTELTLRRHMAETPAFFDLMRSEWRRAQRRKLDQPQRDAAGRFTSS